MDIAELRETELSDEEILERLLFALARAREDAHRIKGMKDDAYEAMLQTVEGQEYLTLSEEHSEARDAAKQFKAMAGDLAVELFDGQDKDVAPGASIAIYANFVLHEDDAVRWAVDNGHSILLRPDTNGFKNLLDRLPEEIYEIEEEPRARISRKDLSELYPVETVPAAASVTEETDDYDIPF
jgi:hypothetical protein